MADRQPIQDQRASGLLDKLKTRTITLNECYELRRWVQSVYLAAVMPPNAKTAFALFVMAALDSKIIELEQHPC